MTANEEKFFAANVEEFGVDYLRSYRIDKEKIADFVRKSYDLPDDWPVNVNIGEDRICNISFSLPMAVKSFSVVMKK